MFLLAKTYKQDFDPTGWFCSEKFDGIRARLEGNNFISRNGNIFNAPAYFKQGMPNAVIDGELWMGHGKLPETLSIVSSGVDKGWDRLSFQAFDLPTLRLPVEERWAALQELIKATTSPYIHFVQQVVCKSHTSLTTLLGMVIDKGGEGVMLRRPHSFYEAKRSHTLYKYKRWYDAEATVIGYEEGEGWCKGKVGTLRCKTDKGVEFGVGYAHQSNQNKHLPAIGAKITYKFYELTSSGKPRSPIFVAERGDL